MANTKLRPRYQIIDGIRCPDFFSPDCFKQALNYAPKRDDVFIVTYPKCGTTWMQNISLYIFRKGQELEDHREFLSRCPFIDTVGKQGVVNMPRPGAMKTHLPYNAMPYSPDAKYIYVLRNPKDCCVSLFYHTKLNLGYGYWEATFDDLFELFMAGEVEYNDYFDHLKSWEMHRKDKQVFFTTYEDMKKDTESVVLGLATFLGKEYIEAIEKDNSVLKNILKFSGFEYMKKHISDVYDFDNVTDEELNSSNMLEGIKHMNRYARNLNPPEVEKWQFVRKGETGDWKNHFSEDQSKRMNKKFLERTNGTEIYEMYKHFM